MDQANQFALRWQGEGNARVPYRVCSDPQIYREEPTRILSGRHGIFSPWPTNCRQCTLLEFRATG